MSGAPNALLGVVKVLSWAVAPKPLAPWPDGGKGYVPHSWQQVPEAKRRYRAALLRHQNAVSRGELTDDESGLSHWYHIATNALFLAELETIQEVK
ncbi:putative phosphodiesterase [Pseudomonas phage MR6]|nr:putative phosphodiesterase [Pseudomonas phage MR6]QJD54979.1 putative phosphodiesterase [Pseudomonas phage MR8]QJD55036.1 putative phosphodiesterase [Pseudomonas phage MR12]